MSFQKWNFTYTPPATLVPDPSQVQQGAASAENTSGGTTSTSGIPADGTRASLMIQRLQELRNVASWLENVVHPIAKDVVIGVDLRANPQVDQAFRRLYDVDRAPTVITYPMYQALVGTEDNLNRTEIELANMRERHEATDRYGVSDFQKMDVQTLLDHYEKGCVATGEFAPNFSLIYRELKGDQVILDSAIDALRIYTSTEKNTSQTASGAMVQLATAADNRNPYDVLTAGQGRGTGSGNGASVVQPLTEFKFPGSGKKVDPDLGKGPVQITPDIPVSPTDIPPEFWQPLNTTFDTFGKRYGAIYDISRGTDCIYQDIAALLETFIAQPLETIARIVSVLKMLKAMFLKTKLKDLRNALAVVILPVLLAMAMRQLSFMDGLIQKAINPLRNRLNSVYKLMSDILRASNTLSSDIPQRQACNRHDLTGLVKNAMINGAIRNMMGQMSGTTAEHYAVQGSDYLMGGLEVCRNTLNWAVEEPMRKRHETQQQLLKMIDKRTTVTGDRLEVLSSLRSVDALLNVLDGVARELQLVNAPKNILQANAMKAAAGWLTSDNQTAAAAKPDVNRILSAVSANSGVTFTTDSNGAADTTQVSGSLSAQLQGIQVVQPAVPPVPADVAAALADLGSGYVSQAAVDSNTTETNA